jgi:hypothetical protein
VQKSVNYLNSGYYVLKRRKMETININLLKQIAEDLKFVKKELVIIKDEIKDIGLEVTPQNPDTLNKIEKGRFFSRKEFEKELAN